MKLLVANGASINVSSPGYGPALHQALRSAADGSVVTFLLDHGADHLYRRGGLGALDDAVISGNLNLVRLFLGKGLNPNGGILSLATDPAITQLLIDHGADVNVVPGDANGSSVLRWAECQGYNGVAEVLRANGAALDMNFKGYRHWIPWGVVEVEQDDRS